MEPLMNFGVAQWPQSVLTLNKTNRIIQIDLPKEEHNCVAAAFIWIAKKIAGIFTDRYRNDENAQLIYNRQPYNLTNVTNAVDAASKGTKWKFQFERSKLRLLTGDFEGAEKDLNKVLKHYKSVDILFLKAVALQYNNKPAEAYQTYRAIVRETTPKVDLFADEVLTVGQPRSNEDQSRSLAYYASNKMTAVRKKQIETKADLSIQELEILAQVNPAKYQERLIEAYYNNAMQQVAPGFNHWIVKAADIDYAKPRVNENFKGNKFAQYALYQCYKFGIGVKKDFQESIKWLEIASKNGQDHAQFDLATYHAVGLGVEKNLKLAHDLFESVLASSTAWLAGQAANFLATTFATKITAFWDQEFKRFYVGPYQCPYENYPTFETIDRIKAEEGYLPKPGESLKDINKGIEMRFKEMERIEDERIALEAADEELAAKKRAHDVEKEDVRDINEPLAPLSPPLNLRVIVEELPEEEHVL